MEKLFTAEKIKRIKSLSESAFMKRDEYTALWQQIAQYTGIDKVFFNQKQNNQKTDIEINNSQASISLNQSSDSMLGILIGDGNFFKIKVKDNIQDIIDNINKETEQQENIKLILNKEKLNNYAEFVNSILKEEFFLKESNFTKQLHKTIKEYFAFGNAGMGVFKNPTANEYSESHLNFINYSVNNCAFLEGKNGDIDNIFIRYEWTAKKIIETFCLDENGNIKQEEFDRMPEAIKSNYGTQTDNNNYTVNYIFMRNPLKTKEAIKGSKSANFVGIYLYFDGDCILKCDFYKKKQFKVIRDNIKTGETYGKGLAGNIIGEIELLNKITGDTIENIENVVRPYLYSYENVLQDKNLTLDRNKLLILNAPSQQGQGTTPPILPLLQAGDITSTIQFLIPTLQNNIATGLKADVFLDFNSKSNMTATETQVRNNIRNKVLFANALDFQNLLNCLIYNSYYILLDEYENKKDETIRFLEDNYIDWFDIEYTSELAQISKNSEIQSTINFLQTIAMITQLAPQDKQAEIIKKIDFNKVNETIASLYNKSNLLFSEEEFEKMMQEEKQALMEQNQALMQQQEAETQDKQAKALKTMAEANQIKNSQDIFNQ